MIVSNFRLEMYVLVSALNMTILNFSDKHSVNLALRNTPSFLFSVLCISNFSKSKRLGKPEFDSRYTQVTKRVRYEVYYTFDTWLFSNSGFLLPCLFKYVINMYLYMYN